MKKDIFNTGKFSYQVALIKTSDTSGVITRSNNENFPEGSHIEFVWNNFARIKPVRILPPVSLPEGQEEYFDWEN